MTSTVGHAVTELLLSAPYDVVSTTVGVAAVLILAVLLFRRDVTRVLDREGGAATNRVFDVALVPFLVVFFIVVTLRLADLVR